jgi:hypothetical protein
VDDFSDDWSYAKEDFERKLHHKRNKVKVSFAQLSNAVPVHCAESEAHENFLWQDLLTIVNPKDRRIVVCLQDGITRVGDISLQLGYANHSPSRRRLHGFAPKPETARPFLNLEGKHAARRSVFCILGVRGTAAGLCVLPLVTCWKHRVRT